MCHAVRAPGSNVTLAPAARAGAGAWNSGSMRTVPVNQSAGPLPDGCEPLLLMSMYSPKIGRRKDDRPDIGKKGKRGDAWRCCG